MADVYTTFAQVSEYYNAKATTLNNALQPGQHSRLRRLSITAKVLQELIGDVPDVSKGEGSTGITIDQIMEQLEKEGVLKRSRYAVMADVRVIGLDVGLEFRLLYVRYARYSDGTIGYKSAI